MSVSKPRKARALFGPWIGRGTALPRDARRTHVHGERDDAQLERFMVQVDRLLYAAVIACGACVLAIVLR